MCRFSARQWNNCATCDFWTGQRQVNVLHQAADVAAQGEGLCRWHVRPQYATASCIRWQAWSKLSAEALDALGTYVSHIGAPAPV